MALLAGLIGVALLQAVPARAEYRAYQLQVVDLYGCRVQKRKICQSQQVTTSFGPRQYVATHGGSFQIGVVMLATWMCYGDTSDYKAVCPRPAPHKPKFKVGDDVVITLHRHITEGWHGKVEVAYYQASVGSNVYGVRFADRQDVYLRYYERDLKLAKPSGKASASTGTSGAAARTASASAPPPGATETAAATAAPNSTASPGSTTSSDRMASSGSAHASESAGPAGLQALPPSAIQNGLTALPTTTVSPSPLGRAPGSGGIASAGPPPLSAPPQ